MKKLSKLWLLVHPVPRTAEMVRDLFGKWEEVFAQDGRDEQTGICIMPNHPPENAQLRDMASRHFGDRCFIDPQDDSDATRLILAEDLRRVLAQRGNKTEWLPYEIWTSNMARAVAEGLKKEMAAAGYEYDPEDLVVHALGAAWQGCLTKYANFVTRYLDAAHRVQVHPELSVTPGAPMQATFVEMHPMPRHVWLYLFKTDKGYPMAQFADGLRAVWEPPHAVRLAMDAKKVELVNASPNSYIQAKGAAEMHADSLVMDVGDGCHGAFSVLIGRWLGFDELKSAALDGEVFARDDRCRIYYESVPFQAPVVMQRCDDE